MKRWFSMVLSLLVFLSLTPMVQAADVTPTPPEWMAAGEYAVFADGAAYQKENWDKILRLRTDAAAGHTEKAMSKQLKEDLASLRTLASGSDTQTGSASLCFELGLITLRYRCNAISQKLPMSETSYSGTQAETLLNNAVKYGAGEPEKVYLAYLWNGRNQMLTIWEPASPNSLSSVAILERHNIPYCITGNYNFPSAYRIDFHKIGNLLTQKLIDSKHSHIACLLK